MPLVDAQSGAQSLCKTDRKWAYAIGTGIALTPIHNLWLTNLLTNGKGEVTLFLPSLGFALWIVLSLMYITFRWKREDTWKMWLGDWRIFVPLLTIVLFMGISGLITGDSIGDKFSPLFLGLSLFAVYVVSRKLGAAIFRTLIPFGILGAVISIVIGIVNPGVPDGGLITNYAASVGFLIFGAVVNQGKWQWLLASIALVGVFFVGNLEGAFIVIILGATVLVRRDFSKRLFVVSGILIGIVMLWASLGYLASLYTGNNNLSAVPTIINNGATSATLNELTTDRWGVILDSLKHINFFGHGFTLSVGTSVIGESTVHNIPLIIVHQIGPVAGLAWLFVAIWCLRKTKWKYAWVAVLAMCVFDHYLWTQWAPAFWCLVGVSTASTIDNDYIFRKVSHDE